MADTSVVVDDGSWGRGCDVAASQVADGNLGRGGLVVAAGCSGEFVSAGQCAISAVSTVSAIRAATSASADAASRTAAAAAPPRSTDHRGMQ